MVGCLALILIGAGGAKAEAATAVSSNWAGYVAAPHSRATAFKKVSGSWIVPQGSCTAGQPDYSATWVGLGGYSPNSAALEQTGTELDCSAGGTPLYSAWYELVPSPSKRIHITVKPGDTVNAAVTVSGKRVRIALDDATQGQKFERTYNMSSPSTDSAEWIAEAPAKCTSSGMCAPLPLANFGTVSFSRGAATTAKGYRGGVADPHWSATAVTLAPASGGRFGYHDVTGSALGGATPSPVGPDSASFTVSYQSLPTPPMSGQPPVYPGSGLPAQ
jgi:hypothetical protein